jgi:hypothetical protein
MMPGKDNRNSGKSACVGRSAAMTMHRSERAVLPIRLAWVKVIFRKCDGGKLVADGQPAVTLKRSRTARAVVQDEVHVAGPDK